MKALTATIFFLLILIVPLCSASEFINPNLKSDVTKTMEVKSAEGVLSDLTFIDGNKAFVVIHSSVDVTDEVKIWKDLQILDGMADIKEIKVALIENFGGSAYAGFGIADQFIRVKDRFKLSVHASGAIASAAVIVFAAFEKRYASENCYFMVHEVKITPVMKQLEESYVDGLKLLFKMLTERYIRILCSITNVDKEVWRDKMLATTWFSAQEALMYNLVTEVK